MSRGIYTVEFEFQTVTLAGGDHDIWAVLAATQRPLEIVSLDLSVLSEVGDAAEEMLRFRWIRGHTTAPSGSAFATAAPTPRLTSPFDIAAGFTARCGDTTIASAGTAINLGSFGFNVRVGHLYLPIPEGRLQLFPLQGAASANEYMVLRMMSTVADDVSMSSTLTVRELN